MAETETAVRPTRRRRGPGRGIQRELRIPGDAKYRPKVPASIRKLLEPYCEVILQRAALSSQEDEYKKRILALMQKSHLTNVGLPNGGSLLYKPGKASLQYVPPKATRITEGGEEEESEEED